ncbi:hypothetical protein NDU88_005966 [Pleurodeles waltl]|uniref:Uncharacterized protein n=1 Tax=Pleurodeles waltl TaxID=8319 RepID=A0AAV7W995_PLEWA|nr:hypothetical protein NDU88_005966 [Pleurodeles waltl]
MITFPTHKGGHILDPFFTNLEGLRVLGSSQLVWTDHMLVKMACSLSDSPFVSQDRFVLKRHWNKLSLEDFYHQLEKAPLGPLTEVDCGYDSFCEWISGALDSLIPMCWSKCHRKEPSPWYDTSLASLKRVCRQAERLWRKSYDSDLKICYLAKIKIYHRAVCQTRASFYAQQFQNSTNPSKLIFKVLKDLMAKRVIAGEICSDSHCEGLASFFHEKVQAIYRTFPTGSLMLEQVGRTLGSIPAEILLAYCPCDGPLLRQVAPLRRKNVSSTSSDPEEHIVAANPDSLPGVKGQEQATCGFGGFKREGPELGGGDGEDARNEEPRSVTREDQEEPTKEENPEDVHAEFEAREAPCTRPGHA